MLCNVNLLAGCDFMTTKLAVPLYRAFWNVAKFVDISLDVGGLPLELLLSLKYNWRTYTV